MNRVDRRLVGALAHLVLMVVGRFHIPLVGPGNQTVDGQCPADAHVPHEIVD